MVPRFATLSRIPKGVWVLGGVSLLMDVSSEMIHSLLPLFMATTLGASVIIIGIIEGVAEATALILKVFSGVISDYVGKRKGLALLGYGLGALSKPLFAIAPTSGVVFSARMIDRVGKGIRGAPRDALVADVTPPEIRGAAYGLRQSLDTIGAFLGPLLAVALMFVWDNDFQSIFWVAAIPAVLSIALLGFGLKEPRTAVVQKRTNPPAPRESQEAFRRLLVGGGYRLDFYPCPLQRSLSGPARPADGDPAVRYSAGDGRHESGLQPDRLSIRETIGQHEPQQNAAVGPAGADRRRYRAGAQQPLEHAFSRRRAVGYSYGHDAGSAGGDGGAHRPA